MSYWEQTEINLGVIKVGKPKKIVFKTLPGTPKITSIWPHCGCTATNYEEKTGQLFITYNNGSMPEQVQGAQSVLKRIDITYEDNQQEILLIRATRIR